MKIVWPLIATSLAVFLGWAGWAYTTSPVVPARWSPSSNPGLTGTFAPNDALASVRLLPVPTQGPEDVACAADGSLYTGLADGRVIRLTPDGAVETFAQTRGRPLGMVFDANGHLLVADAHRGLLRIDGSGRVSTLVDQYRGRPLKFVDDLDVAADGTVYFSDVSLRFSYDDYLLDFYEGSRTGRLFEYRPDTGAVRVLLDGLFFANGVALGPDDQYVLVNETGLGRIQRVWLSGPQIDRSEVFLDGLPGTPDNINFDGHETFWVAMPSLRAGIDAVADKPVLRRLVAALPTSWQEAFAQPASFIVGVNTQGKIVTNLQDPALGYPGITSATPCGDQLMLGSLHNVAIGVFPVPANRSFD